MEVFFRSNAFIRWLEKKKTDKVLFKDRNSNFPPSEYTSLLFFSFYRRPREEMCTNRFSWMLFLFLSMYERIFLWTQQTANCQLQRWSDERNGIKSRLSKLAVFGDHKLKIYFVQMTGKIFVFFCCIKTHLTWWRIRELWVKEKSR